MFLFYSVNISKFGDERSESELGSKEGVKKCPPETTEKRNYLKGRVEELGRRRKAINGGTNSDRISLETVGEQELSA